MAYIGQIELTKKKPPKVETDTRAWADLYDTLNHLIDSVNSKSTTEQRRPGDLHNSIGDIKVFKDKTDNKYYMETMTEDGSAKREMFISDKDVRSGEGFYSTSSAIRGGGTGGTADTRNIEQQLFEAVPWTGGTPNNITVDSDGKLVTDTVAGAIVSNNYIVQADLVGSGKTWAANQKPNLTTIDNDGKIVLDEVEGATVSNSNIVAANIVGGGKPFTTKPPVTFKQDGIPTSLTVGDLWYDTNDGNKLYIAESVGADAITGGEWVATVDATIATAQSTANTAETNAQTGITNAATAQSTANTAETNAQTGITNAASAQSTANSALSSANGKNISFYQDEPPTALATGDMWFDTNDEYKMYRWGGSAWNLVNAVPTLSAIVINASQINAGTISSGLINTASLAAATITADAINMDTATISGTLEAGNINVSGVVTSTSVNATELNADRLLAGTITSARINTASISAASINADNITAGTLSAAEINMSSGLAQITTGGDVTTKRNVRVWSSDVGDGSRYGLQLIKHGAASITSTNWWMLFNSSSAENLVFNHGGSNVCELTTGGLMVADQGIGFNSSSYYMMYDNGHILVYLNGFTDGGSIYPYDASNSVTDGYDLGKSNKKWRKLFVTQSNVGDLVMANNDGTANWTLREKPDCILARNSITQKTFMLNMTETSEYDSEVWDEA